MGKKNNAGGITILGFKTYYRVIVTSQYGIFMKTDMKMNGTE
jgi:hypothetical protein